MHGGFGSSPARPSTLGRRGGIMVQVKLLRSPVMQRVLHFSLCNGKMRQSITGKNDKAVQTLTFRGTPECLCKCNCPWAEPSIGFHFVFLIWLSPVSVPVSCVETSSFSRLTGWLLFGGALRRPSRLEHVCSIWALSFLNHDVITFVSWPPLSPRVSEPGRRFFLLEARRGQDGP